MRRISILTLALAAALCACSEATEPTAADASTADSATVDASLADAMVFDVGTDSATSSCGTPATCVVEATNLLGYQVTPSTRDITNTKTDGVYVSEVDATAGGFNGSEGAVYARFTDTGLETTTLSDVDALTSADWDIAFRRFVVRLNSGVAGPSCVEAARAGLSTTFESLTEIHDGLQFRDEGYFTTACEFVSDGSGLPSSPLTALGNFWEYPESCVKMTFDIFVVRLASGRHVKLRVDRYYSQANQDMCQASGSTSLPSGSGQLKLTWAFLD